MPQNSSSSAAWSAVHPRSVDGRSGGRLHRRSPGLRDKGRSARWCGYADAAFRAWRRAGRGLFATRRHADCGDGARPRPTSGRGGSFPRRRCAVRRRSIRKRVAAPRVGGAACGGTPRVCATCLHRVRACASDGSALHVLSPSACRRVNDALGRADAARLARRLGPDRDWQIAGEEDVALDAHAEWQANRRHFLE